MAYPSAGNPKDFQIKGLVPINSTTSLYDNEPIVDDGETTNFDVIDCNRNAVSSTMTHGSGFGTKVVVGNTRLIFNNGTRWGSVAPYNDNVNVLEGGKIALLGNGPTIVLKDGKLFMAFGTPGGEGIGQTIFRVLLNVIDFGMGIQEAIEASRGRISAKSDLYIAGAEITVGLESRITEEAVKAFKAKGHTIRMYPEFTMSVGGIQGILVNQEYGTWTAGGDPRREGYAVGYKSSLIIYKVR
jgi:gamma-glutamyltranspeptidase/glutathione hydrolase